MAAPFIFREDTLRDQVVFITGGATGLGYAMAERMARCGAHLILASRNVDRCTTAATGEHDRLPASFLAGLRFSHR